jgi:hypothetical protein
MKITSLTLRNIACFEDVTFTLGSIVLIQGQNASGKTALVSSLKFLFGKGHDPDFLRAGTTDGEIIAMFDDGTQVRAALTKEQTVRMYKPAGGKKWNRSREFIETVSNALSYDPVAFLQKPEKEQVSDILRLMPIEVDPAEVAEALKPIEAMPDIVNGLDLAGRSPLDVINTIRGAVYEARTGVHIAADTHEKHAGELEESMKAMSADGRDWAKEVQNLNVELSGINGAEQRLKDKLTAEVRSFVSDQEAKRDKLMLLEESRVNGEIAKMRQALAEYKAECLASCNKGIDEAKAIARQQLDTFAAQQVDDRNRLTTALAQAEQSYAISLKLQSTRDSIVEAKKQAGVKRTEWKAMSACLENIDKLKAEVAGRLPLGIDISDGRICRAEAGGLVPLSKWNDASRLTLALKIATLCHGQAGFVCIDSSSFDHFDPERKRACFAALRKYVQVENMQFIVATVSDGPLKVEEVLEVDAVID